MKRRLLAGLIGLVTAASVVGLGAPSASATPYIPVCPLNTACGTAFYQDQQHSVVVGYRGRDCQGRVDVWGVGSSAYSAPYSTLCDVSG